MRVDFAPLIKGSRRYREGQPRYSPAEIVEAVPTLRIGKPHADKICTSRVEQQNLSIRTGTRRLTAINERGQQEMENLKAAYALWFAFYNFCRLHQTVSYERTTRIRLSSNRADTCNAVEEHRIAVD